MSDLRVSFPVLETPDGETSLDARSFRQAALALASGNLPRQLAQQPVYIVAPERRRWIGPAVMASVATAALVVTLLVWLL